MGSDPSAAGAYLKPLVQHAMDRIPPSLHSSTPIFLLATAGMRLLTPEDQAAVLSHSCQFLRSYTRFKIDAPSETLGPCGSSVRIITGEEEGLFGWIAVNYLMDGFTRNKGKGKEKADDESRYPRTTYGFLDMGGASTQIAFEPNVAEDDVKGNGLVDVRLRLLSGEDIHRKVFVTTWLGYGTNQARERYVGQTIQDFQASRTHDLSTTDAGIIPDPCLPRGLELTETPAQSSAAGPHATTSHKLVGTGSFEECVRKSAPLLNKDKPCLDAPCLMDGIHVPPIDFSASHFIGVSEYWYSSEHIFGLGGAYDFSQYERAAVEFCGRDWEGIVKQHEDSSKRNRLGGDGEVVKDGKVVELGVWGPQVEIPRLQMQCFKAAWILNVLHEGIGMPRIADPGGKKMSTGDQVVEQAVRKGLGKPPIFQSLDSVDDVAISWTLGKMVLEASKEVTPLLKGAKPLVDPIDDIENYDESPVKPIRPYFSSIEDKLTPHLPSSLTRESLGFSPVLLFLWMVIFLVLFVVVSPLRRRCRTGCLRFVHGKRAAIGDLLEEGKPTNGNALPSPTMLTNSWIRRVFSGSPTEKFHSSPPPPYLRPSTSGRSSLTRNSSLPTQSSGVVSDVYEPNGTTALVSSTSYSISRGSSPGPGAVADHGQRSLTSRSRSLSISN